MGRERRAPVLVSGQEFLGWLSAAGRETTVKCCGVAMVMPRPRRPGGPAVTRVAEMQAKLHRWAAADPGPRFDDLVHFVHDPATLIEAFARVARVTPGRILLAWTA